MPRENSFSDSEGRSLTPDLEEDEQALASSPINTQNPQFPVHVVEPSPKVVQPANPSSPAKHSILSRLKSPTSQTAQTTSVKSPVTHKRHPWAGLTPTEKFRAAARKVISLHRGTSYLSGMSRIGAEPGVNPRRASANILYGHIREECTIQVVDYNSVRSSPRTMTNAELVDFLNDHEASERPSWSKVRWINIGGLSWDVVKAVSIKYDLHPLALEDVFHSRSQTRSKADYYPKHLFLRLLCHELAKGDQSDLPREPILTGVPRSASPEPLQVEFNEKRDGLYDQQFSNGGVPKKRRRFIPRPLRPNLDPEDNTGSSSSLAQLVNRDAVSRQNQVEQEVTLDALKAGERVNVKVAPAFIFLFRDGTVISINTGSNHEMTAPISRRLGQRDTGLRTSADASMLVHAILDLIVDQALEIIDEYHSKINKFERAILLKPDVETVRYLHILSEDLVLIKRTMDPIKTLIYGLRRYDQDRCAALVDMSNPANAGITVVGFMSHKSKIYLADVMDHMVYVLTSLDMFASIAENLISYTFNIASYEMNQTMRLLTTATIIFLPLTLLTGYFGMNFVDMFSVNHHSDVFFWEIALPLMAVIIPLSLRTDIKNGWDYIQKKMVAKKAVKTIKQA